jgi:hypothetical protein
MKTDIYQKLERDFGDALPLALEQIERVDVRTKGLLGDRMLRAMNSLPRATSTSSAE